MLNKGITMYYYYGESTINDISKIESTLNLKLPDTYKDFLLKYGGILIDHPNYVNFSVNFLKDSLIDILKVFNLKDLLSVNDNYLDEIEDNIDAIIFASDPGGNFFLIDKKDKIYYWDRTLIHTCKEPCRNKLFISEAIDEDDEIAIYFILNSFNDFLNIIYESSKEQNSPFIFKNI